MYIAIFQSACSGLSRADKIERLYHYLCEYSGDDHFDLDLVVCPELFVTGYNVGDELIEKAEPARGASFSAMSKLCQKLDIALVYGYSEVYEDRLYNSAAFVNNEGDLIANHRKQFN